MSRDVLHSGASKEMIQSLTRRAYLDLFHGKVVDRQRVTLDEAKALLNGFNASNKLTGFYELSPLDMFQPTFVMTGNGRFDYPFGPRATVEMGELAVLDLEGRNEADAKTLKSGIEKVITTLRRQIF